MANYSEQQKREAFKALETACRALKSKYCRANSNLKKGEIKTKGNSAAKNIYDKTMRMLNDAMALTKEKTSQLDKAVQKEFPEAYKYVGNLPESSRKVARQAKYMAKTFASELDMKIYRSNPEVYDQVSQSLKNAPEEIAKQKNAIIKYLSDNVEQLDSTLKSKYPEVYNDVLRKYEEEKKYRRKNGIGHPWGTEYRRRVAAMIGLKKTVNSMYELGLASLLNAQTVNLGPYFIKLIEKDPGLKTFYDEVKKEAVKEIKNKLRNKTASVFNIQSINLPFKNSNRSIELGGKRHPDDMSKQLMNIYKIDKYKATWKVGFNTLTWAVRHGRVLYSGTLHVAYNFVGFTAAYEFQCELDDKLDLRPHGENKLDFATTYGTVTSILGTGYHDIIGATDNLIVKAQWTGSLCIEPTKW